MTVNISAQNIALTIGSQNWSAWIESIQIGYGEYEMGSGLMPCTGTVNLIFPANYAGIPSNPEYRFNSTQWRRGQLVQIAVGGAALPCSGNALKIIKPPHRPNRGIDGIARMAISVGCALAYNYFPPEPNDDFSGITAGNPVTFGVIINSVLSRLGIPTSVNVGNYQIDYPLPKIEGNWLDFCGQLADNAGWYLRCDTNGTVISEWITDEGSSGVTYTIGTDESDWTAIGDVGETPIEKLIVTGIKKTLEPVSTDPNVVIEEQPIGFLMPDIEWSQPTAISLTISKRTITNRSRTLITSTVLETIEEPLGVILPDLGFNQPTSISLGISKKTTTKTFFDDGTITKTIETIEQPLGVILPDLGFNQPTSISLGISKRTTRQWTKIGNQKYREGFTEEQPLGVTFPDLGFNQPTSISLGIIKETTTEGESAPPTDQPISDFNLTEEQIKSEIYAAQLAVSEGRDRQRTISLPYAVNESQLTAYGIIFNKILVGRAFGWRFATRLNTALLPMRTVRIVDGTQGYILRMDAMQWAMTQTEAYIVFNGIEDGVFAAATPNVITYPVSFPMPPIEAALDIFGDSNREILEFSATLVDATYSLIPDIIYASLKTNIRANIDYRTFAYASLNIFGDSAIASGTSLNDKILAYWNFQEVNLDGNFENQVNIADLPLVANASDTVAGIIGNGLLGNGNNYGDSTDTRLDPQVARFLGIGGWINTAIDTGNLNTFQTYEEPILSGFATSGYYLRVRAETDDPVDIGTITYSVVLQLAYDSSPLEIVVTANAVGWNFFYFEINFAAGEAKLSVNAGAFSTLSFSEIDTIATNFNVGGDTNNDLVPTIDEIFVADEALDLADLAVIYNSGSANAYPF